VMRTLSPSLIAAMGVTGRRSNKRGRLRCGCGCRGGAGSQKARTTHATTAMPIVATIHQSVARTSVQLGDDDPLVVGALEMADYRRIAV